MLEDYYVKPSTVDRVRASWLASQIESYLHHYSRLVVYCRQVNYRPSNSLILIDRPKWKREIIGGVAGWSIQAVFWFSRAVRRQIDDRTIAKSLTESYPLSGNGERPNLNQRRGCA